jgi:REP element-mobilizing transposase RayT
MDLSRFNGLPSVSHVYAFLFSLLDTSDLGNLKSGEAAEQNRSSPCISRYMAEYAEKEGIYMKINCVNADRVHALIDLPTALSVEKVIQLLKGASSHWINSNDVVTEKFAWGRGYGAFSVSQSNVNRVARYSGSTRASSRAYFRRGTERVY